MIKKYYIVILFLATMSGISEAIEQQDCEIMQSESGSITLGFKAGTIGFGVGPEITFGSSSGVNWSGNVQYMVAEYQELCSRYNTGRISKVQYDKEIQNIIERSRRYEMEQAEYFRKKREIIFNEMKEYER